MLHLKKPFLRRTQIASRFLLSYVSIMIPFAVVAFTLSGIAIEHLRNTQVALVREQTNRFVQQLNAQFAAYQQGAFVLANVAELQYYNTIDNDSIAYHGIR